MMQYITYFKLKFITTLQYRAAALAGIFTQFFFGLVFIMLYMAFYESDVSSVPMELNQLITYIWLGQAFFALTYVYHRDDEIINMITSGNIAYELCRPGNLYYKWLFKIYGSKLASTLLKSLPIIIIGFILPSPYNILLPNSTYSFIGFILTLLLGSILITSIVTLIHVLICYTLDSRGLISCFKVFAEFFAGGIVPIPFLPKFLQVISQYLPFQYISDIPYRIYVGNVLESSIISTLAIQLIWIVITIVIGLLLTKKALKKIIIQGG